MTPAPRLRLVGQSALLDFLERAPIPAAADAQALRTVAAWAEELISACGGPDYLEQLQRVLDELVDEATPDTILKRFLYLMHVLVCVAASSPLETSG